MYFKVILIILFNVSILSICSIAALREDFFVSDDKDFKEALIANSLTIEEWVESINIKKEGFYCLGETHRIAYRNFLSTMIFPNLKMDTMFFEADTKELSEILDAHNSSKNATLVGIDISSVLSAVFEVNPSVKVFGVENTNEQQNEQNRRNNISKREFLSGDGFAAQNAEEIIEKGKMHFSLYGSNHCSKNALALGGLITFYRHLLNNKVLPSENMKSILMLEEGRGDFLADFFWRLGLNKKTFVIPDTSKIDEKIYNYNWKIKTYFDNYDTIIFFN